MVMVLDGTFHKTYERGLLGPLSQVFHNVDPLAFT